MKDVLLYVHAWDSSPPPQGKTNHSYFYMWTIMRLRSDFPFPAPSPAIGLTAVIRPQPH